MPFFSNREAKAAPENEDAPGTPSEDIVNQVVDDWNRRAVNSLPALVKALEALTDRDAAYHGNEIRITCESHGDAIRIMREARAALASHKTGG